MINKHIIYKWYFTCDGCGKSEKNVGVHKKIPKGWGERSKQISPFIAGGKTISASAKVFCGTCLEGDGR